MVISSLETQEATNRSKDNDIDLEASGLSHGKLAEPAGHCNMMSARLLLVLPHRIWNSGDRARRGRIERSSIRSNDSTPDTMLLLFWHRICIVAV